MDYSKEELYWIWLSSIEGIGVKRFGQLRTMCHSLEEIYNADVDGMARVLGEKAHGNLIAARNKGYLENVMEMLEKKHMSAITPLSRFYPPLLMEIIDAPITLFVIGNPDISQDKSFAVVGSRRATRDGQKAANDLSVSLSKAGVAVVSGLARGIDSCAHVGCLQAGGRTIAVLGCGADVIYPPENGKLYHDILTSNGSIVSEYMPGTQPYSQNFPARNRIISGMCCGVLLVEGAKASGTQITINYALEQGRDVYALPGSIYAPQSEIPNKLIHDGCKMVLDEYDILEEYGWGKRPGEQKPSMIQGLQLTIMEELVVNQLHDEALSYEELRQRTNLDAKQLNSLLTMLELRGIIKQSPGKLYRAYL